MVRTGVRSPGLFLLKVGSRLCQLSCRLCQCRSNLEWSCLLLLQVNLDIHLDETACSLVRCGSGMEVGGA